MASTEQASQAQASCQQLEIEHAQAMSTLQVQTVVQLGCKGSEAAG